MILGILKETGYEKRVALLPEGIIHLKKLNIDVLVENEAGLQAFASDKQYEQAGGLVVDKDRILKESDVLIKINSFTNDEIEKVNNRQVLISFFAPFQNTGTVNLLKLKNTTAISLDMIPRTTRAQSMDILSSMATIAGYRAVLDAALHLPRFFPMFMSAAGTIKPAKVLILGAGVAGLQAIATSRKLGAIVEVFDVRAAVKEEVMSLGGKFIEVEGSRDDKSAGGYAVEQSEEFKQKQKQLIHDHALKANVIITTAQIPGKQAPILVTKETVENMMPGSVIIDLAASTGGNCELTQNGKIIDHNHITIIGKSDYPSDMPSDASKMVGNNILNFLKLIVNKEGQLNLNFDDDIIKGACIVRNGEIVNERLKMLFDA